MIHIHFSRKKYDIDLNYIHFFPKKIRFDPIHIHVLLLKEWTLTFCTQKMITCESRDHFRLTSDRKLRLVPNFANLNLYERKVNILKVKEEKIHLAKCEKNFE